MIRSLIRYLSLLGVVLAVSSPVAVLAENPTTAEIKAKVLQAVELIKKEKKTAFDKIGDKSGEYVWKGTYIWIHGMDGLMYMHPFKPAMNGNRVTSVQDPNGKKLFLEMNTVVELKGSGWVDYMWPKPDTTVPVKKISYVHGVDVAGTTYVVGCGIYDVPEAEVEKLLAE